MAGFTTLYSGSSGNCAVVEENAKSVKLLKEKEAFALSAKTRSINRDRVSSDTPGGVWTIYNIQGAPVAGVFPSYIASNAGPSFTGRLRWPERVWIPTHLDGGTAIPIKDSIKQKNKEIWRKFTWLVLQV